LTIDINGLNLCDDDPNEGNFLVNENASANEMFAESPHLVAAQVLIGESELDIVGGMVVLVYLMICVSDQCNKHTATLSTLVTVTSVLFFTPNASAAFLGNDIWCGKCVTGDLHY
jgi:hypothetical protein